jgi:hypothetical protein
MKKKVILGILVFAVVITIVGIVYAATGSSARLNYVKDYLESKGYSQPQIQSIEVKHSFLSAILGYQQWVVQVEFADELGIIYHYYNSNTGVSQGSFSGDDSVYGNLEKEELLEMLKHLER